MTLALVPVMSTLGGWALVLLAGVVFAETGLLVGFFLPGDSLLFAAGIFAAAGVIPVAWPVVALVAFVAAVVGDQVAFRIGARLGPRLFARRPTRLWSPEHVEAARGFFDRHGPKAIVMARFVPLVRTFTPVVAGSVGMPVRRFGAYNLVGGALWALLMVGAGVLLGGVPWVAAHVEIATLALIAVSLLPAAVGWVRRRSHRAQAEPRPAQDEHVPTTA